MQSQPKQVLIIHNNEEKSQALALMVERAGHQVTTTWSGIDALGLAKSRTFDLVLVNSYLADMYVGEFFERFSRVSPLSSMIMIEEGEPHSSTLIKLQPHLETK